MGVKAKKSTTLQTSHSAGLKAIEAALQYMEQQEEATATQLQPW